MDNEENSQEREDLGKDSSVREIIDEIIEHLELARPVPLSRNVVINKEFAVSMLELIRQKLPEEIKDAKWLLHERDELIANAQMEAEQILQEARVQAERMVARSEIVRNANNEAERIIREANNKAKKMIRDAVDYCDKKLAQFEIVLKDLERVVGNAREKLVPHYKKEPEEEQTKQKSAAAFFDQEQE